MTETRLHNPVTFESLPAEIIARIALLLDTPSTLSLIRVSRKCVLPPDTKVWRSLDISVHPYYGRLVLESPQLLTHRERANWEDAEGALAEDRHRAALKHNVSEMLAEGDSRRWGMVRDVKVVVRRGAGEDLLPLFQQGLTHLRTLEIYPPVGAYPRYQHDFGPMSFGRALFNSDLRFPALTHIRIGQSGYGFPISNNIMTLFRIAPNLISLDCDIRQLVCAPAADVDEATKRSEYCDVPLQLQMLRISFISSIRCGRFQPPPMPQHLLLLNYCPRIRQLSIIPENQDLIYDHSFAPLLSVIRGYASMRDLYWEAKEYMGYETVRVKGLDQSAEGFASLRRLMIKADKWMGIFSNMYILPSLEILYIDPTHVPFHDVNNSDQRLKYRRGLERELVLDARPGGLSPDFAAQLRRSPQLRVIEQVGSLAAGGAELWDQLDDIEAAGNITGHIWSLRHAGSELLHLLILPSNLLQVSIMSHHPPYDFLQRDGTAERTWVDYTDFDGLRVPLETIRRMKEMEGLGPGEGDRRGVEVGEDAWQVLLDWRRSILAGEADSPA